MAGACCPKESNWTSFGQCLGQPSMGHSSEEWMQHPLTSFCWWLDRRHKLKGVKKTVELGTDEALCGGDTGSNVKVHLGERVDRCQTCSIPSRQEKFRYHVEAMGNERWPA